MNSQTEFQSFSPTYGYQPVLVKKQKKTIPKVLILFLFIGILTITALLIMKVSSPQKTNATIISPLADASLPTTTLQSTPLPPQNSLEKIVIENLKNKKGTYAVSIKNLKTQESFNMNEDLQFDAASLYKLWIMAVTFEQIEQKKLKEEQILSAQIQDLNSKFNVASEAAEMTEGEITLSVEKALEQMITISHNYAALLLTSKVKLANVRSFLTNVGLHESKVGSPPKTTSSDMALFYEKLYKGEIVDETNSKKMLDLLSRQRLNDRIPKYLPERVQIAHKTGELGQIKHDAGIVFLKNNDFIFVALSETKNPADAAETTALLSKEIYEYFNTTER